MVGCLRWMQKPRVPIYRLEKPLIPSNMIRIICRYIGEVILQLLVDAMASHSNSTKPLPQLRPEYILLVPLSSTTHVCFLSGAVYN